MKYIIALVKGGTPRLYAVPEAVHASTLTTLSTRLMLEMVEFLEVDPKVVATEHEILREIHRDCRKIEDASTSS